MTGITKIVVRHWKLLLAWNTVLLVLTAANIKLTPKEWTSKAELILPNVTSNLNADLGKLGNLKDSGVVFSQQLNPLKILSSIATSNEVITKVWEADPEKGLYKLKDFKGLFHVSPESESTVISVTVNGSSPEIATQRGNTFIEKFQQRLQELRTQQAMEQSEFIQTEVKEAHNKLLRSQTTLAEFKRSANLVSSEDQTKNLIVNINTLDAAKAQVLAESTSNKELAKLLSNRLNLTPSEAMRSVRLQENKEYQSIRQKLSEVEGSLTSAQVKLTNDHPIVKELLVHRQVLVRQLQQNISESTGNVAGVNTKIGDNTASLIRQLVLTESEATAMQKKAELLQSQVDNLRKTLKSFPSQQAQLQELQSQYEIAAGVYNGLVAQAKQAKLGAFSAYPTVQVLDQFTVEPQVSSPKVKLIVLGAIIASAFSSIAIVLFMENRNPLLNSRDIQRTKIPVLGSISPIKGLALKIQQHVGEDIEFQRLASSVSLMQLEKARLMIASATSGEGKTIITVGLANALINLGFRVLVVDGDFRKAQLSRYLNHQRRREQNLQLMVVNIRPGLDLLTPTVDLDKVSEFVARGRFEECLSVVQDSGNYDYVLVDSASINMTSETTLIATAVSNVLFVVRPGVSDRNPFNNSIEQLTRHKATIVGLVVNGVETNTQGYLYDSQTVESN
ncbi:AAA family ATPase [Aetokthonos hydrillicola Thurmond2011]|jgi:uncharacterized protein involved in exopolysaccharide biosynthesis/Mrp family chromosome partitioning ATPase|uniref:AAA family ATPase n=1 Tax=Aetokthonos hydrillicola Thurmond2011 TaxID=2712845 RepID=A0AAP5I3A5_9CYAN|nr:tyrosine-protein kinase domain-containing protein [Aetokthonos hydrillicola]MBO3458286.1 AAA family ATPase [Aetokthonos hydrillicola CCALA 1050]MBW4585848.1 AAA family ATPase [Aetokthonos hydrillicola CCALA 1050]MDR9893926.1 AAA family ATPase [Aetokthonos hydrillicola Thurmond2011]